MESLRFGVTGIKGMGHGHVKTMTGDCPAATIGAICDIDIDAARARRDEYGLDVPVFAKFEDMLAEAQIDAVTLATPHYLHCPQAVAAAEAGKHVLTEKPLAIRVTECDKMIDACSKAGVILGVGHQRRWSGAHRALRNLIQGGELGRPMRFIYTTAGGRNEAYYASGDWRGRWDQEGGGALINQFVHDIDALCYLLGRPVELSAQSANWGHKHEVDDLSMAVIRFDTGWIGTLSISLVSAGGLTLPNIYESDLGVISGMQVAKRSMSATEWIASSPDTKAELSEFADIEPVELEFQGRDLYYREFLDAVNGKSSFEGSGEECRWAVEIVNAIFLSALTGRRVEMPLDRDEVSDMYGGLIEGKPELTRTR
jgi:UDP-N-acetyl-2-amino-2-deoxyglucuronate dehydrogenase